VSEDPMEREIKSRLKLLEKFSSLFYRDFCLQFMND